MQNSRVSGDSMSRDERRFDASQYTFFGKEIAEEGELGGIEEEEGNDDFAPDASIDEFHFSSVGDQELAEAYASLSHIDDLSSIFAKLNRAVSDPPRHTGIIGDRSSFSRDSSNTTEWMQETETQNSFDRNLSDSNNNKIWWSNPLTESTTKPLLYRTASSPNQNPPHHHPHNFTSKPPLTESNLNPLHRTFSSPNQNPPPHHHQNFLNPKPPLTESNLKPLHRTASSPNQNPPPHHHQNFLNPKPPLTESNLNPLHRTFSSPNQNPPPHHHQSFQNFSSKAPLTESNSKHLYRAASSPNQNPPPHHFLNPKPKMSPQSRHLTNLTRHSSTPSLPLSLSPLSSLNQHPIYGNLSLDFNSVGDLSNLSSFSNFSSQGQNRLLPNLMLQQQQMLNHNNSLIPSILLAQNQMLPSFSNYQNPNHFNPHASNSNPNPRPKSSPNKSKQKDRFAPDPNLQKANLPQFSSKYMSQEEIQNIHKIQHNMSHNSTNSYLSDYYHQACLSKRGVKLPFYPSSLKDVTNTNPKSRSSTENLSFLPSIRNPKPLSEANTFISKSLERETMVAVRLTLEDSFSLLLDIDDIDRTVKLSVPTDGGYQLKKRRQILLETLASSLQLTDPLRTDKKPDDPFDPLDRVFLLIISLPKGRKLISKFLKLVPAGSDLSRIICMAVFRHLRSLFGSVPTDSSETLIDLAKTVCFSVCELDLSGLSACLAAVVCSSEQPPLRPIGCPAGDGATIALKSVLDRATDILLNSKECGVVNINKRVLWQASFDAFFGLLSKYCVGKYEGLVGLGFGGEFRVRADVAREMPVELLRASLPHTDEKQRRVLLDFAQRSMVDPVHVSS